MMTPERAGARFGRCAGFLGFFGDGMALQRVHLTSLQPERAGVAQTILPASNGAHGRSHAAPL